jgi:hypothetical protein
MIGRVNEHLRAKYEIDRRDMLIDGKPGAEKEQLGGFVSPLVTH